jgi:uncharacterized membrane-anchored protein YhcB (DUF1043 family)
MYDRPLPLLLRRSTLLILLPAAAFVAGYFLGHRIAGLRHGRELEQLRAEQQRVTEQYRELGEHHTRTRELIGRVRTVIGGSTELLHTNDGTIHSLRGQLQELGDKVRELKTLVDDLDTGGTPGGEPGNGVADEIGEGTVSSE